MRGMRALALVSLVGAVLFGCGSDKTALLVEVSSVDLASPSQIDELHFLARSDNGATAERGFALTGSWPQSLSFVPPADERSSDLVVTVTGRKQGAFVVRHVLYATLVPGQTTKVTVRLEAACRGVMCGPEVDCHDGFCDGDYPDLDGGVDAGRDAGTRDAATDAPIEMDAGELPDGGSDSGTDSGSRDAGMPDAGRDAGMPDAGRDAGMTDSGPIDAGPPPPPLLITEVDYDEPSMDTADFVEILNTTTSDLPLDGLVVILINGSSTPATEYDAYPLNGALAAGQYLVVGQAAATAAAGSSSVTVSMPSARSIQNGDPDGIALYDSVSGTLVSSLAYGGAIMTASVRGHTFSLVNGGATSVRDSSTAARTLCRLPDARWSDNDAVDWTTCATPTPGAPNVR
jgi:Lamin Tail Domain